MGPETDHATDHRNSAVSRTRSATSTLHETRTILDAPGTNISLVKASYRVGR